VFTHPTGAGRYISIILHNGELYCIDSTCFHAGGPLALGEIEELNSTPCIVCPWHYYHISLQDGEKWYQGTQPDSNGKLQPGLWKRCAVVGALSCGADCPLTSACLLASRPLIR
jgi:nitrite reductase/ring-hydroxylating ferredoxin subunit